MKAPEIFPPSREELEEMIDTLRAMLQDERHSHQWKELYEDLVEKERELAMHSVSDKNQSFETFKK